MEITTDKVFNYWGFYHTKIPKYCYFKNIVFIHSFILYVLTVRAVFVTQHVGGGGGSEGVVSWIVCCGRQTSWSGSDSDMMVFMWLKTSFVWLLEIPLQLITIRYWHTFLKCFLLPAHKCRIFVKNILQSHDQAHLCVTHQSINIHPICNMMIFLSLYSVQLELCPAGVCKLWW